MDQSQGGNPFGRLIEFARPHKTGYIVSVVLAVLGVAFGIVPYFATARMTIELLSGNCKQPLSAASRAAFPGQSGPF